MSLPEVLLWQHLRKQPLGVKFRRQHPVGAYVLDFFCAKTQTAIEIDGIVHDMGNHPQHDTRRDRWLAEQGIEVLRIPASEVLHSPGDVAAAILRHCQNK